MQGGSHWRPIQDGSCADTSVPICGVSLWGVYAYYVYADGRGETKHNKKKTTMACTGRPRQRSIIFYPSNPNRLNICCSTSTSTLSTAVVVVVVRCRGVQRSEARGWGVGRWRHRFRKYADSPSTWKRDYVMWIRAKNFSPPCLCLVPLLCCCSYYVWQRV